MLDSSKQPKVVNFKAATFESYSLQGTLQSDIEWSNISWNNDTESGFFLVRFAPGGKSIPHEHKGYEEFVVLEGELIDNSGKVFRIGDCVSFGPGSKHFSTSPNGATVAVLIRDGFRTLDTLDV